MECFSTTKKRLKIKTYSEIIALFGNKGAKLAG